jgi:hypothetical protein
VRAAEGGKKVVHGDLVRQVLYLNRCNNPVGSLTAINAPVGNLGREKLGSADSTGSFTRSSVA